MIALLRELLVLMLRRMMGIVVTKMKINRFNIMIYIILIFNFYASDG